MPRHAYTAAPTRGANAVSFALGTDSGTGTPIMPDPRPRNNRDAT
jgi:hypothetical protein